MIKVALDAMGGDNAPGEIVKGAVDAVNTSKECFVYLVEKKMLLIMNFPNILIAKNR